MHVLLTHNGNQVDLANPDPDTICLVDIAHSLSALVRFNGHLQDNDEELYSVAEHSILVTEKVHKLAIAGGADINTQHKLMLNALLHDAHEAYCGDITAPVSALLDFKAPVDRLKTRLQNAIHKHFVRKYNIPKIFYLEDHQQDLIDTADNWAVIYEAHHLHSCGVERFNSNWHKRLSEEDIETRRFAFYGASVAASAFAHRVIQQIEFCKN